MSGSGNSSYLAACDALREAKDDKGILWSTGLEDPGVVLEELGRGACGIVSWLKKAGMQKEPVEGRKVCCLRDVVYMHQDIDVKRPECPSIPKGAAVVSGGYLTGPAEILLDLLCMTLKLLE